MRHWGPPVKGPTQGQVLLQSGQTDASATKLPYHSAPNQTSSNIDTGPDTMGRLGVTIATRELSDITNGRKGICDEARKWRNAI